MTSAMSLQRIRAKSCKRVNHKFTLNFLKAPELGSEKMAHDAACSKVTTRMLQCKMVNLTDRISQTPCKQSRALSLAHTCGALPALAERNVPSGADACRNVARIIPIEPPADD